MSRSWKKRFSLHKKNYDEEYDEEARKLFAQLNLSSKEFKTGPSYDNLNAVWKHPTGNGTVFIGNQTAAASREILKKHDITRVVNCTADMPCYHDKDSTMHYFRFQISYWFRFKGIEAEDGTLNFFAPVLDWIDAAVSNGENVMIHCLAGAHRAGTTGTIYVMHATGMDLEQALQVVKRIRPVVQPIGMLGEVAKRFDDARKRKSATESEQVEDEKLEAAAE